MFKHLSNEWKLIWAIALLKLVLHLLTFSNYELHRDALLYYSLGQHLDWGFASVPPGIGVIAAFGTWLLGQSTFALRIWPALAGVASVVLIGKIIIELKGGTRAILIGCLAFVLSPAFLRSNALFQPVSFDQLFWLWSGYLFVRLVRSENPRYWVLLCFVGAIAFLTKYSIVFFMVSVVLALLSSRHWRLIFNNWFLIGMGIGLLVIAPNLLWQYRHGWPLIHHLGELQRTQFAHVSVGGFLFDQLLMNLPGIFVWLSGFLAFLFLRDLKKYRFLAVGYLLMLAFLLFMHGKSYYTLGFYSIFFALGAVAVEKYRKPSTQLAYLVFMLVTTLPLLPFSLPMLSFPRMAQYSEPIADFTNRWEDGKTYALPQDYADMTGWKELGELVGKSWQNLPDSIKNDCVIFANNYGQAGAVLYYAKQYGCPEPVCLNDQFLNWAPEQISEKGCLLYIDDNRGDMDKLFGSVKELGEVQNPYFRENGLKVFLCVGPVADFPKFYTQKVSGLKSVYLRSSN